MTSKCSAKASECQLADDTFVFSATVDIETAHQSFRRTLDDRAQRLVQVVVVFFEEFNLDDDIFCKRYKITYSFYNDVNGRLVGSP